MYKWKDRYFSVRRHYCDLSLTKWYPCNILKSPFRYWGYSIEVQQLIHTGVNAIVVKISNV